jgi:hypothetical protein
MPVFALLQPFLQRQPLPNPQDLADLDNYEHSLLCMDKDAWSSFLQSSMIYGDTPVSSGSAAIDDLEDLLNRGEDFSQVIEKLGGVR